MNRYIAVEEAMAANVSLEEAPSVYAQTECPASLRHELRLDDRILYRIVKRGFDIASSAAGIIILSPLIAGTAIAVRVTSPGPIIFRQKRVGKGKRLFDIYKFRTMRTDTPDLPSHLINANDWLTPIGAVMRRYSLDELPQLANVLHGDMSVVGPRPALWSQFDLVAERDKYGANDVRPGLTGWAQINGRDELDIRTKAARDGEYVQRRGLLFDLSCFVGTFAKLITGEGVVEAAASSKEADAQQMQRSELRAYAGARVSHEQDSTAKEVVS